MSFNLSDLQVYKTGTGNTDNTNYTPDNSDDDIEQFDYKNLTTGTSAKKIKSLDELKISLNDKAQSISRMGLQDGKLVGVTTSKSGIDVVNDLIQITADVINKDNYSNITDFGGVIDDYDDDTSDISFPAGAVNNNETDIMQTTVSENSEVAEVNGINLVKKLKTEEIMERERFRVYDKPPVEHIVTYKTPKQEVTMKQKIFLAGIVCVAVSIFIGLQANSYVNYDEYASTLKASFAWIASTDIEFTLFPFYIDVFFPVFGGALLLSAIVTLFVFLNIDTKKKSRIGEEQGSARLGTSSDFKEYKKDFMD